MFDPSHLLAGGFALTVLAAFWSRIKSVGSLALGRLVVRVYLEDEAATAVAFYCWRHFKRSPYGGARRYCSFGTFVRPVGRHQDVGYETVGKEPLVFWSGWRPLVMRHELAKAGEATLSHAPVVVTYIRGTFDADAMISVALEEFNAARHQGNAAMVEGAKNRFRVERVGGYRTRRGKGGSSGGIGKATTVSDDGPGAPSATLNGNRPDRRLLRWTPDDLGPPVESGDPFAALALTPAIREVVESGRRWLASESWYKEKRIPWRMGWLLYGKPGTGKSSLVRAVGQSLDLPVFAFDLATFDNPDLTRAWQDTLSNAPCIVLLEDIDGVFHGRKNVTDGEEGNGVTFDCLLNCISGVGDASGVLTVVTTNRVELLDEALGKPDASRGGFSTRPGRIDRAVEMPALDETGRRYVAARILADCPGEIERVVSDGAGDSGAQFEDRCARVALADYWRGKEVT